MDHVIALSASAIADRPPAAGATRSHGFCLPSINDVVLQTDQMRIRLYQSTLTAVVKIVCLAICQGQSPSKGEKQQR